MHMAGPNNFQRKQLFSERQGGGGAYRFENQEAGEEVEEAVEKRSTYGGKSGVRSESHHHHAVVCECDHPEEEKIPVPEKLGSRPLKPNHGVADARIHGGLQ
jgi:hypothetical protein